jgi:hypothetical protein
MAVETSFASVSFPLVAVELPIGEFAAEIRKYMDARAQRKGEPTRAIIEDLRAARAIVMQLTDKYVQSMLDFSNEDTISDPTKLQAAIDEANEYLMKRQILPNLIYLTEEIKGQVNQFSSRSLRWLDAVWTGLEAFQRSVGGQSNPVGGGMITAVGLEQLKATVKDAEELLKLLRTDKPSEIKMKEAARFEARAHERYESTNIRPSDEVHACVGRAIGELGGA